MIFAADPELRKQALLELRAEYKLDLDRPGLHQSSLSGCLTRSYNDKVDFIPPSDKQVGLFTIGFAFERVLLAQENRPEPFEVDGITLSLDTMYLFGPSDLKTTRKRAAGRKGENGFQMPEGWRRQFAAYLYGINAAFCDCGHLRTDHEFGWCQYKGCVDPHAVVDRRQYDFGVVVLHLIEPEITAWRLTFTPEELEENWNWLLQRKRQLEWMLAHEDPQPFQHNADWECDDCVYSLRCGLQASLSGLQKPSSLVQFPV
jgi:hypothetical protein